MRKEVISTKQGTCLVIMFLGGTASLATLGVGAKEDIWLANIFTMIMSLILALIYSHMFSVFLDKNLFDIIEFCFGNLIGKIVMLFFTFFFFEEGTLVLINFSQFITTSTLRNTPIIIITIAFIILCTWFVKKGISVMGQWTKIMVPLFILFIITPIIMLIPNMNIDNIRPFVGGRIIDILKVAVTTVTWPFGEIIALTMIFSGFETKKSAYKIYIIGLLIGGSLAIAMSISNVLVLGVGPASRYYHPTYLAVRKINLGDLVRNMEIIPNTMYTMGAFVKISVYLMATAKGIAKIFECKDYKILIIPVALLIIDYSIFNFEGISDFWEYSNKTWTYTAIMFEIIFPIIIYLFWRFKINSKYKAHENK